MGRRATRPGRRDPAPGPRPVEADADAVGRVFLHWSPGRYARYALVALDWLRIAGWIRLPDEAFGWPAPFTDRVPWVIAIAETLVLLDEQRDWLPVTRMACVGLAGDAIPHIAKGVWPADEGIHRIVDAVRARIVRADEIGMPPIVLMAGKMTPREEEEMPATLRDLVGPLVEADEAAAAGRKPLRTERGAPRSMSVLRARQGAGGALRGEESLSGEGSRSLGAMLTMASPAVAGRIGGVHSFLGGLAL